MTEADKRNIYDSLVSLLTTHCNTCLDKHLMEKILLCAFKLDLIDYAELNEYTEEIEGLWESLAKTLNISDRTTSIKKCNCSNGVCALC